MSPVTPKLFSPLTLGGGKNAIQLSHRVVMSPLTRLRSDNEGVVKNIVTKYYAQRATEGGLIISEATNISATARGYYGAPGLFTEAQVEAWKSVTQAVHDKGGKIFCQLWHTGRVGHPLNQPNGELPVSSSATSFEGTSSVAAVTSSAVTVEGRKEYVTPRALETDEVPGIVEDYRKAAVNAIEAGFDGVELHAANGYLLEQFLCDNTNQRTDKYGGSIENRARFIFEALDAILSSLESSQVGMRLSPYGETFGCKDSTPTETYTYVVEKLNKYDLAFLDLLEPRGFLVKTKWVPEEGVLSMFRQIYNGVLFGGSDYNRELAIKDVEAGTIDGVTFGRHFISNPDLVERLRLENAPMNEFSWEGAYLGDEAGYTDYPSLNEIKEKAKSESKSSQ